MTQMLYSNAGFEQSLEIRKDATFNFQLDIVDVNDTPMDISDWEFRATVASKIAPTTDKQEFTFGAAVGNAVIGTLTDVQTGTFTPNDNRMALATYRWNCDAKTGDGEIIPVCFGDVIVKNTDVDWSAP